jgi:uncharacterized protein (UPF0335 family)
MHLRVESRWFKIECHVHNKFFPVISAVTSFEKENEKLPNDIKDLVPKYIKEIPFSSKIETVEYKKFKDGKNWELKICCTQNRNSRIIYYRSNDEYSKEEKNRIINKYHSAWVVLSEK